jgi:uncharacterized protein YjlB
MNVLSHIDNYMHQQFNFLQGCISSSWVNIYEKTFYQELHSHQNTLHKSLSGVLYLTEKNSDIEFNADQRVKVSPEFADILLFPDDTLHRVLPNKEDFLRISLAFNYYFYEEWKKIEI